MAEELNAVVEPVVVKTPGTVYLYWADEKDHSKGLICNTAAADFFDKDYPGPQFVGVYTLHAMKKLRLIPEQIVADDI